MRSYVRSFNRMRRALLHHQTFKKSGSMSFILIRTIGFTDDLITIIKDDM